MNDRDVKIALTKIDDGERMVKDEWIDDLTAINGHLVDAIVSVRKAMEEGFNSRGTYVTELTDGLPVVLDALLLHAAHSVSLIRDLENMEA